MSIRAPPSCSKCLWYGHNKRRCHRMIQDPEQREYRRLDNLELKFEREQTLYEQSAYEVDQSRRLQLDVETRQLMDIETRRLQNIEEAHRQNIEYMLSSISNNEGIGYINLLTNPNELKEPQSDVYVSDSCPICMETIGKTNVTTMLCGHQTCTGCFARNIIESKSNCCPMCREKVF